MKEPLRLKPHHAEGAQRAIKYGKNESHVLMLSLLENRLAEDPNAELIFVREFDELCELHCDAKEDCIKKGKRVALDETVAEEHDWEFEKPYKISDVLDKLRAEAIKRTRFAICEFEGDEYEKWLEDIRASKEFKF